jgi:hypothetical protein
VKRQIVRRRRLTSKRSPNRQKTLEEVSQLEGTEYHLDTDSGVAFRTEDESYNRMITMGELIAKFYRLNRQQKPLVAIIIDEPSKLIHGEKIWQVIMRGNFYIVIEQNQSISGPHPARLWFQTFVTKKNIWLASMQIMAFFFNEEQMVAAIRQAVDGREFFMLPANYEVPINPEI